MPTGHAERLMPTLRRVVLGRPSAARSDGELLGAFITDADGDAFAELVRRHGPMVLGVCRRVIGDRATADDAFQATFLVLARRAATVRPREQVGNFLYGVAYRTALKARGVLARRRAREKQVSVMPEPTAPPAAEWADLQPVIDEELANLPDKLRLPVVLCDLEGRPQREVARHLNVPPATLATRLATARRTLAQRLTRRGVTLSGGALAGLLAANASTATVPPGWAAGLARAAEACASGMPPGTLVSANAVHLSEGVLRMMVLAKLKAVAVLAVTALALSTGLGVGLVPAAADDSPKPTQDVTKARVTPLALPAAPAKSEQPAPADDATFLKRLTLDLRGTPPTDVELWFFVSDSDAEKRAKVADWLAADDAAKQAVAKKLGVPADRLKLVRGRLSADGRFVEVTLPATAERFVKPLATDPVPIFFSGDGNWLAVDGPGRLIVRDEGRPNGKPLAAEPNYRVAVGQGRRVVVEGLPEKPQATEPNYNAYVAREQYIAADEKAKDADPARVWAFLGYDKADATYAGYDFSIYPDVSNSDAEFLKRVLTDVRGSGPTALETKYFTEDKDVKKREKLLDTLLKDPAVQKKLGDAWKAKMLAPKADATADWTWRYRVAAPDGNAADVLVPRPVAAPLKPPAPPTPPLNLVPGVKVEPLVKPLPPGTVADVLVAASPDKFEKLVDSLIVAKKDDAAILEAITLAALSRLPTDTEKKLAAGVGKAADRKAAWVGVARALAGADDKPTPIKAKLIEAPPVPPKPPAPPLPSAKP
jgi:RNA polymerase sigma factor (sigma-70 family)